MTDSPDSGTEPAAPPTLATVTDLRSAPSRLTPLQDVLRETCRELEALQEASFEHLDWPELLDLAYHLGGLESVATLVRTRLEAEGTT
jgi:hypothetical protein